MSKFDENEIVIIWRDETKNLRPWFKWTFGLAWMAVIGVATIILFPAFLLLWPIIKLEEMLAKPIKHFCKWAFCKKDTSHE